MSLAMETQHKAGAHLERSSLALHSLVVLFLKQAEEPTVSSELSSQSRLCNECLFVAAHRWRILQTCHFPLLHRLGIECFSKISESLAHIPVMCLGHPLNPTVPDPLAKRTIGAKKEYRPKRLAHYLNNFYHQASEQCRLGIIPSRRLQPPRSLHCSNPEFPTRTCLVGWLWASITLYSAG